MQKQKTKDFSADQRLVWPPKPIIYQINTWVWLDSLSRSYNWPVTLENLPSKVYDELASYHVDAIWLMGVWQRSAAARQSALKYADQYKPALPDLTFDDIIGSPYAVGAYQVDEHLGGRHGLAVFRERLRERGMQLILDFVPNHVATDHAWVQVHPEYLLLGTPKDLEKRANDFFAARDRIGKSIVVAHGRDPNFPGWIDTAQVNAFNPGLRRAALHTLLDIAAQCDGVRCDMAMLMLNEVFARTWGGYAGAPPATEYWEDIIPRVKEAFPSFLFIGEVYWDLEARMNALGFDYCYDKRLYDRLRDGRIGETRAHLCAPLDFQRKLIRFIENHDEARAAECFGIERQQAAAVMICTLPGATLLHDGQFSGRRVKLPVQIGRQPFEPPNEALRAFYMRLMLELRDPIYQEGEWRMFAVEPGQHNGTHYNLIAYGWRSAHDYRLIVINLSGAQSQGHVQLGAWPEIGDHDWHLHDVPRGDRYLRHGELMENHGLYVDLRPYQSHIFHFERAL